MHLHSIGSFAIRAGAVQHLLFCSLLVRRRRLEERGTFFEVSIVAQRHEFGINTVKIALESLDRPGQPYV